MSNKDHLMSVHTLSSTCKPNQLVWLAAHQDYSSLPVHKTNIPHKDEPYYGERIIEMLLKGDRGHFGCFEHPSITFNCAYVPHSCVVQARTHRVGVTFDVQSFRYTSDSILSCYTNDALEKAFYFRPVGKYTDRHGKNYDYTEDMRRSDMQDAYASASMYRSRTLKGVSEEHCRGLLPEYRQHMVVTFNARSLMHFLDLRAKADAQLEIQWLCEDLLREALLWMPEIFLWYQDKRWKKARLAP